MLRNPGELRFRGMDEVNFPGWRPEKTVQVVEWDGMSRVLVKGQPYMSWQSGDEGCVRLAIVQLYECELGTQEDLAEAFGRPVNSVQRSISDFAREGMRGLIAERGGPKGQWKITPEVRGRILLIALREGINRQPASANDCLAPENFRIIGDPLQELGFVHRTEYPPSCGLAEAKSAQR